jgi:ParB family transcriptional regulator, chromosome partitioning protein
MKAAKKGEVGMLAGMEAGAKQHGIDKEVAKEADRRKSVAILPLDSIQPREDDTRPPRADHVLSLAESIAAVGLIQSIAVDRKHRLIAGLHRWTACRLLSAPRKDRIGLFAALDGEAENAEQRIQDLPTPGQLPEPIRAGKVPCRVLMNLDAAASPHDALAAEAAENTARRQYTPSEVAGIAERLLEAGYVETKGRPAKGKKALRPALELVLGVSPSTVRRMLGRRDFEKGGQVTTFSTRLERARKAVEEIAFSPSPDSPAIQKAIKAAEKVAKLLPAAIAEAKQQENEQ